MSGGVGGRTRRARPTNAGSVPSAAAVGTVHTRRRSWGDVVKNREKREREQTENRGGCVQEMRTW